MKLRNFIAGVGLLAIALSTSACTHRLIPFQGEKTVKVFDGEEIFSAIPALVKNLNDPNYDPKAKPYAQMLLGLALKECREVEGDTRVKILSSDSQGSNVEVLEGPYIGYKGFVDKRNLR